MITDLRAKQGRMIGFMRDLRERGEEILRIPDSMTNKSEIRNDGNSKCGDRGEGPLVMLNLFQHLYQGHPVRMGTVRIPKRVRDDGACQIRRANKSEIPSC